MYQSSVLDLSGAPLLLYLLQGCKFSIVLRWHRSNEYSFVNSAEIHGAMKGELWPADETSLEELLLV